MSNRKETDLPATWSVTLGSAWVREVSESGLHQSSSNLRSWKAGLVVSVSPLCGGTGHPPNLGQSNFQWRIMQH